MSRFKEKKTNRFQWIKNKFGALTGWLDHFYIRISRPSLFYWLVYHPIESKVKRIWEKSHSKARILYIHLMGYFTSRINILTEEDFSRYVASQNNTILRPKDRSLRRNLNTKIFTLGLYSQNYDGQYCHIDGDYSNSNDYPILSLGNLNLRKDKRFYLNFTNERYTGATVSSQIEAEGYVTTYFLDGSFVFRTHYRNFQVGNTLVEREVTRNGYLFCEEGTSNYDFNKDPGEGIKEVPHLWVVGNEPFIPIYSEFQKDFLNDCWYGSTSNKKYYKNGALRQEKKENWYPKDTYSIKFYYLEGPIKEEHIYKLKLKWHDHQMWSREMWGRTLNKKGKLVVKKYYRRTYNYGDCDQSYDDHYHRIKRYDPQDGSLIAEWCDTMGPDAFDNEFNNWEKAVDLMSIEVQKQH